MREIKFRGKSDDDWVYGHLLKVDEWHQAEHEHFDYFIQTDNIKYEEYECWYITNNNTIGQYTGLKDKNGVEIYEGDIVKEDGYYGNGSIFPVVKKIQWKESYSCWLRGEYERLTPKNIKKYNIEVIGNIYDNPELLEKEE